ncbi:MAG: class I SAM-dependent methyltransferase [Verrucomicrobia bacterium]|nr:class I SAM-dependent methyltransferase [Verrucomicrobiota bacterium]
MKQNKYDEPEFFAEYSRMARSIHGLAAAMEWTTFRALLPDLRDKRVLDLGCGFGWHCRYAHEHGAAEVVGIDLSEKMLARARATTDAPGIKYLRSAIEDIDFPANEFDIVMSSLALHYVESFNRVCCKIHHCLTPKGLFLFSVEHPIFTTLPAQNWYYSATGERLHWPIDNYQREGCRQTNWLTENVIKYHRTMATYVNTLIQAGFLIKSLEEPKPDRDITDTDVQDQFRRPPFLVIAVLKDSPSAPAPNCENRPSN